MSRIQQLREFIADESGTPEAGLIDESADLFGEGWLDSLSLLRLIAYMERTFGIAVEGTMVVPGNFATLRAIDGFVARRQTGLG